MHFHEIVIRRSEEAIGKKKKKNCNQNQSHKICKHALGKIDFRK